MQGVSIINTTNYKELFIDRRVFPGETLTIDAGERTAVSSIDGNILGSIFGDFEDYYLEPGNNTLAAYASGVAATTTITVAWYARFAGLGA